MPARADDDDDRGAWNEEYIFRCVHLEGRGAYSLTIYANAPC